MAALKVKLYIRIRLSAGRSSYAKPIWNRNRTLREGYACVGGTPQDHPEGQYYLRYLQGGKRRWQAVGPSADEALTALRNTEHDLQAIRLGRQIEPPTTGGTPDTLLRDAIESYLCDVRRFRMPKTVSAYERILGLLRDRHEGRYLASFTRKDLLDHRAALEAEGLAPRTVFNHLDRIKTFLRARGVIDLLRSGDMPEYDEPEVEAYDADQLEKLFAAANAEERLLFDFFLKTGFREQEVMYCTWKNVDFKGRVVTVRTKLRVGFRPKDKAERSVPVPDDLIAALAARKVKNASTYIFPAGGDVPNGHFLRMLKKLALRARLNCQECLNKAGESCQTRPVCEDWVLHKFRKTFATMHHEAGVPVSTVQHWLGHEDLSTTLRYLAIADLRSDRTRQQVNTTFGGLRTCGTQPPKAAPVGVLSAVDEVPEAAITASA